MLSLSKHGAGFFQQTANDRSHRSWMRPDGATELLHNLGRSLGLHNITRQLLDGASLKRYIEQLVGRTKTRANAAVSTSDSRRDDLAIR